MDNKNKKKTGLIIGAVVLVAIIIVAIFLFIGKKDNNIADTSSDTTSSDTSEYVENPTLSCYDYIINTMYESHDNYSADLITPYDFELYNEIAKEKMPNGNGFFYDEEDNTFYRGYTYKLILDFENNMAFVQKIDNYNQLTPEDNRDSTYTTIATFYFDDRYYEYNGEKIELRDDCEKYNIDENGNYVLDADGNKTFEQMNQFFDKEFDEDTQESDIDYKYIVMSLPYHIEKMMYKFNKQFEAAGCPLYGVDSKTMQSYKNKEAHPVEEETVTDKINAPWDLDYYTWNAMDDGQTEWLDNYNDVFNIQIPSSLTWNEAYGIDPDDEFFNEDGEFSCFGKTVLFVKDDVAEQYDTSSENATVHTEVGEFDTIHAALAEYLLKPAQTKLYNGTSGVYYYPFSKVSNGTYDNNQSCTPTVAEYKAGNFNFPTDNNWGYALTIDDDDQSIVTSLDRFGSSAYYEEYFDVEYNFHFSDEYTHEDFPFTNDYFFNFLCLYTYDYAQFMGLR